MRFRIVGGIKNFNMFATRENELNRNKKKKTMNKNENFMECLEVYSNKLEWILHLNDVRAITGL